MIRKPTPDEFAYGAMLLGTLLVGILLGVSFANAERLREWIGAFSGWAAAIAAGVTLVYLRATLEATRQQAAQAALQNDIATGNLPANIFVEESIGRGEAATAYRVVIENQNSRDLVVKKIALAHPKAGKLCVFDRSNSELLRDKKYEDLELLEAYTDEMSVRGWIRQNEPKNSTGRTFYIIMDDNQAHNGDASFEVTFVFRGDNEFTTEVADFRPVN